jgi:hypothetical protein
MRPNTAGEAPQTAGGFMFDNHFKDVIAKNFAKKLGVMGPKRDTSAE